MSRERQDDRAPAYLAVGRFVLEIGSAHGTVVREAERSELASFRPRVTPILLRPGLIRGLVGRRTELGAAVSALDSGIPVELSGEPGIGKSAILRHLAHLPRASFVDGTVYLSARHQSPLDLRQRMFDSFYESETPGRPTDAEIRRGLQDKHALIMLDEAALTQHELEEVFDVAPRCAFVIATRERALFSEARNVALTGLPVEDAIVLLERELERPLDAAERASAAGLCAAIGGHPRRIRQAAAILRERGTPVDEWPDHLGPADLIVELVRSIDEKERRVMLALAALPNVPLHIQHVSSIAELTDVESVLTSLVRRGLVTSAQSRYRLVEGVADRLRRTEDLKPSINRTITYFTAWADRQRRNHEHLLEAVDPLVRVQEYAVDARRWGEALRLGRQLERTLVVAGRWGAWGAVLERCLSAAKGVGDRAMEAWALHEIGTRAVCLGDPDTARRVLDQAARLREELGEPAAAGVSRRNLQYLAPTVPTEQWRVRPTMPFEDIDHGDSLPLRTPRPLVGSGMRDEGFARPSLPAPRTALPARRTSRMSEAGALAIACLLCAALVAFTYDAVTGRRFITHGHDAGRAPAPAAAATSSVPPLPSAASQPPTPPLQAAAVQEPAVQRARILIFTARPGSIVTRRTTDLCYAVSSALQARIEPTVGTVETTDALTCRRVAPARTTAYELTAMGRDGVPVSQQLVIVVR